MSEDAVAQTLAADRALAGPAAELWHRVALGQLSADEAEARLLEGRKDVSEEERAEIERAKRVFEPPSEEQRRERLEQLLARSGEQGGTDAGRIAAEGEVDAPSKGDAAVVPMQPHRTRRWVVGLLAAAAAVVLTVWLVPPTGDGPGAFRGGYDIELGKAAVSVRGTEPAPEVPTFVLDGKIGIRLVPEEAMRGPIGVVAYVWDRKGRARRLELEPVVHESGVVEFDTTVKALGLEEGEHELVIAIGWAEALPSSWEEIVAAEGAGPAGFEVVRSRVRVVARLSEDGGDE